MNHCRVIKHVASQRNKIKRLLVPHICSLHLQKIFSLRIPKRIRQGLKWKSGIFGAEEIHPRRIRHQSVKRVAGSGRGRNPVYSIFRKPPIFHPSLIYLPQRTDGFRPTTGCCHLITAPLSTKTKGNNCSSIHPIHPSIFPFLSHEHTRTPHPRPTKK